MNNKVKELLLERFEIISRAADDCTYILTDCSNLSDEEIEHKLCIRLDRINSESQDIEEMLKRYFTPVTPVTYGEVKSK